MKIDYPEMSVIEIDDFVAMRACEMHDYMYNIIRPDDIVVPPRMICFKKIKWRNLLSTGNQWTEIDLNKNRIQLLLGQMVLVNLLC